MIPATYRASFGYLLRHPWQFCLVSIGIMVGVAVIVAVDLANASARKAFVLSMDAIVGEATHQVIGGPRGVSEEAYTNLRVRHGYRAIAPVVEGVAVFESTELTLLGVDLFAEWGVRDLPLLSGQTHGGDQSGGEDLIRDFLSQPGSVAMSQKTADEFRLEAGDRFDLTVDGHLRQAKLIAVFDGNEGRERLLFTDIATAQEWLAMAGWLSRIDVRVDDSESSLDAFRSVLPPGAQLLNAARRTRATADMSSAFMTNLTAMSLLALLVGVFLIFNGVAFSILQRRGLIGVLRALGLTRRQLVAMLLVESGLIGLCAAALGVLLGVVLGEALLELVARTINDLYFRVTVTDVRIEPMSAVVGLAAGVGAALVAAAIPAWEAASYPPRLALMRSELEQRTRLALPVVSLCGLGLILVALLLIANTGRDLTGGLVSVFLLILGFAVLIPLFVRLAVRALSPIADRIGGASARIAVAGISASLSRTAIAIVALTIAVSATVGVSVMVDSFRGSVGAWLQTTLRADLYASARNVPMEARQVEAVRSLQGVVALSTLRQVSLEDESGRTRLRVIEMAPGSYAGTEILGADSSAVWPRWETEDVVLASEPYAFQRGIGVGDVVRLPTGVGARDFEIAGIFQSFDVNASALLMSRATYSRHFDDDSIGSIGIYLADGVSADAVAASIGSLEAGEDSLRVISNANVRQRSLEVFDRTFIITDVLYWLTMSVAFIGVLSAMMAVQIERTREFGTLRALGMTPRQLGGLIVTQTGVIGFLSGVAAIPVGLVMALVLIKVINRRAFGWQIEMAPAPDTLLLAVAFAVGAAILAGLYPAIRAGRQPPAVAMREE
jgi:putative ABC transport system permease protein